MDGYQRLANAVVKKAAWDYEEALCADYEYSTDETRARISECEVFFKGKIIMMYTNLSGPLLMAMARKHCAEHDYKIGKVRADRRQYAADEDEDEDL